MARSAKRIVLALPSLGLAVVWFLLLRPSPLGGRASYIIVSGTSMQPTLHGGDLAVMRVERVYERGDIIAFRASGGIVIHRIVSGSAEEGFTTQGDNKTRPDLWRPKPRNILGRMWFHLPGGGRVLAFFKRPLVVSGLVVSVGSFSAWRILWPPQCKRRPLDGRLVPVKAKRRRSARAGALPRLALGMTLALAVAALAFLGKAG